MDSCSVLSDHGLGIPRVSHFILARVTIRTTTKLLARILG